MLRLGSSVTAVMFALAAAVAQAAPARIKVFEAQAHASPDAGTKVVHTFAEGSEVSVSEKPEQGWRRVRLPDGGAAFVRDDEVTVVDAPSSARPATQPVPAPSRAPLVTYVHDLSRFAELVQNDPMVAPQVVGMERRRSAAVTILLTSVAVGGFLMIGGATFLKSDGKVDPFVMIGGGTVLGFGVLLPALMWPRRAELVDRVNEWNERHPDHPLAPG